MRFISLFTGVGGFDLGFDRAGHECVLQVEQDKHCLEVLRRRWPNVPKMEDVRDVTKQSAPDVDMVIGGFPCTNVSVAGLRAGLAGSESGLWFEFHRIISELRPRIAVIENVPGLFSSNGGNDFGTILRGLSEQRYMSAWRVLDAQYFGVPQRRRRVFIVASLGDGACAEILFERESVRRDSPKSRKTRPGAAGGSPAGTGGGEPVIADTLRSGGDGGRPSPRTPGEVVYNAYSVADRIRGTEGVASTLSGEGGRTGAKTGLYYAPEVAEPIPINTMAATRPESSDQNRQTMGVGEPGDPMYTIQAGHHHAVHCIDMGGDKSNARISENISPTMSTSGPHAVSATVTAKWAKHSGGPAGSASETDNCVMQQTPTNAVRRLTPVECCRLQGFPDDWNDDQTDSQRYRQMGNAVCVPVAEWIGRRIAKVHNYKEDNHVEDDDGT